MTTGRDRLRRSLTAALVLVGCSRASAPLDIALKYAPWPGGGVPADLVYSVTASWPGGDAGPVPGLRPGAAFALAAPAGQPLDIEVDGRDGDGGLWRGEVHQATPVDGGVDVLVTPLGAFVSFLTFDAGPPPLAGSSATPLDLGRVLIVGGMDDAGTPTDHAWIYDQRTLRFTEAAHTLVPRSHHAAIPLDGGLVLLAGGDGDAGTSVELYDPTDGGRALLPLGVAQVLPSGAAFVDGNVAVGCGYVSGDAGLDEVDDYLIDDGGPFAIPCAGGLILASPAGPVVVSPDGSIYVAGAGPSFPGPIGRLGFTAALDGDGGVVVIGGMVGGVVTNAIVGFWPDGGETSAALATERAGARAIAFDGGILVVGGVDGGGNALASAEILSSTGLGSVQQLGLSQPRLLPAIAAVPGYRLILVVSGENRFGEPVGGLDIFTNP